VSGSAPLSAEIGGSSIARASGHRGLRADGNVTRADPESLARPKFGTVARRSRGPDQDRERREILAQGPNIMQGYYNKPTDARGDRCGRLVSHGRHRELDADGYLKITDRKKDLLKTAEGSTSRRNRSRTRCAEQVRGERVVLGDQRKFPIILIVPTSISSSGGPRSEPDLRISRRADPAARRPGKNGA